MPAPIVINTKHDLGIEGAKAAITRRYEYLKETVKIDRVGASNLVWDGDTAHLSAKALGQQASGVIAVRDHDLTITVTLPMILQPFGKALKAFIVDNKDAIQPGPKPEG